MMRREKDEIKDLQNEIDNIKDQKNKLTNEIMQIFKNIYNYELDLNVLENDLQYQNIIDVFIAALVGEGKRDHELIKFYKLKKEINDNMRSIQYYKIITKKRILKKKKKEDEEDDMIDGLLNEIEKNAEEKE